jgi:hypothetical protein
MKCFKTLIVVLAVTAAACSAYGQSDVQLLLSPNPNDFQLIFEDDLRLYGDADIEDSRDELGLMDYRLRLRAPLVLQETSEYFAGIDFDWLDLDTDAGLPTDLYDLRLVLGHRRTLNNGWKLGGFLQLGSASDQLFDSWDEMYLAGTGFLQVPHLEYTSFIFLLNVDTSRDIPAFPGIAYFFPISRTAYAVVGLPVLALGGKIGERTDFNALLLPYNANAGINYAFTDRLDGSLKYTWGSRYFMRADRHDDDDRLVYDEMRASAGLSYRFTESATLGLEGGYAFNRDFSEGDDRDERDDNELEVDDAWFGALSFELSF